MCDKDRAITDAPCPGSFHNCLHDQVCNVVWDDNVYLGFGEEVHHVFRATVEFGMAALSPKAPHLTDRHPLHASGVELLFDLVQLEGLNERFDFFIPVSFDMS
jgi:hypothetical protein